MTVLNELSAITAVAAADGVEAKVNVEGRLVGLSLTPEALLVGPVRLAATILRLSEEASAAALNEGIEVLAPHVEAEVTDELRALTIPTPKSAEEDYSTVETWALPR
jgi:hypothetical protein